MAFDLIPPPPPTAPLSYSPPDDETVVDLDLNILEPLREAVITAVRHISLHNTANRPSIPYYLASSIHDILFNVGVTPLWQLFPSQPSTPDIILAELQAMRADLNCTTPTRPYPTALPDTVALATLDRKFEELKEETKSSLKSFAEAVKAPAPQPPPP